MQVTPIFTIGTDTRSCGGHGDNYSETVIKAEGSYGCGPFPPCFYTRKDAEDYIKTQVFKAELRVVELRLLTLEEGETPPPNVEIYYRRPGETRLCSSTVPGPFDPADFFRKHADIASVVVPAPGSEDNLENALQFDRNQFKLGDDV